MFINFRKDSGFSLLEMTVVLIIITMVSGAVIPHMIQGYLINAANKAALDMSAVEEAGRAYYVDNKGWPVNIAALQAGKYLPPSWNAINPFGLAAANPAPYSYNIASNVATLTVSTTVPDNAKPTIENLLPLTSVSGGTISSTVSVPGSASTLPAGAIIMWSGPIASIPSGFVLCDGGNGTPDLRDRFIVGAAQDNNGVAMTDVTGALTQSGNGQLPATLVAMNYNVIGGIGGRGSVIVSNSNDGAIGTLTGSFGTGPLNVAVYYALAYIMKA